MNINLLSIISTIVLLVVSTALGFMGSSVEMGLAIAAGAIGLAFSNIDKISSFEGAGFKAEMWKKMEAIVEKETEVEQDTEATKLIIKSSISEVNNDEAKILKSLSNQKFTWRTLSGISKESKVIEGDAKRIINDLMTKGYIAASHGTKGKIWSLTSAGRRQLVINALLKQAKTIY